MDKIYIKSQVYHERRILKIIIEGNGYLHDVKGPIVCFNGTPCFTTSHCTQPWWYPSQQLFMSKCEFV